MTFRVLVLTLALLASILTACGGETVITPEAAAPSDAVAQAQPTTPPATAMPDDAVVATVNGEAIFAADFNRMLTRRQNEVQASDPEALETFVLTTLINQRLTEQEAERMGIIVTDADLDAEIAELQALTANGDTDWQTWLAENDYTDESFRNDLRAQLIAAQVRDRVVSEADLGDAQLVHARHILVSTESEANDLRTRLLNGESFVDLAAQYSNDVTTREQGGDLGWFTEEELLEPIVAQVAFAQNAGDISQPVATRLGYHIVQTLEFDNQPLPPEKQAQVAQVIFDEWLTTLNDSAMIEINR